ncbi:MAG: tetratricopeptide repeat protein [Chitinophagaceae bacterium]|nr:tetratricopeptide repeat protein [Chitinophagaceae bacterium]
MRFVVLFLLCFYVAIVPVYAQDQLLNIARQYLRTGDYEKAASTFKQLVEYNPEDESIATDYIQSLLGIKDYKQAEKFIRLKIKGKPKNDTYQYELAKLLKLQGDEKKANKMFEEIIQKLGSEEEKVRSCAVRFEIDGMIDYAIASYIKGKSEQKDNTYLFAEELAILYDKKGDSEMATGSLLDLYVSHPEKSEEIKSAFLRMIATPDKLESLRKKIQTRATKEPEALAYPDLLAWLFIQQKDYESAFTQIRALDLRLNEMGRRVLGFARVAFRELQFKAALSAYDYVIEKGQEHPFYLSARSEKLSCLKEQLRYNPHYTPADVAQVEKAYGDFIEAFPAYKVKETIREYAELEARYANRIDSAIALLENVTKANNADRVFKGKCKLEMGDYELIRNNIWESTLLYSQVDKDFKQDMLGEEARFKNAKLSYYTGDFVWAQGQLDVLKASTSELIANDALNLSVLIVENNPPADSNSLPLLMYARADLLKFQHKDEEALKTLDSISTQYPKHPLADNILMERADIAYRKQDYSEAAMHLQAIVTSYAEDILADDALYHLAYINEQFFSNKDEAKRLYEQLITKYPGSSFVNEARKRFRILRGDKPDVETPSVSF